jgi:hypothetical protein
MDNMPRAESVRVKIKSPIETPVTLSFKTASKSTSLAVLLVPDTGLIDKTETGIPMTNTEDRDPARPVRARFASSEPDRIVSPFN